MQIDFHHAVVYVIARMAGFAHRQADIVAYCSQYVDDATNSGTVKFDNGAMYTRISSAHKALDYRNFSALANRHVWIPFHFLPGNGGKPAGGNPDGSFIHKITNLPGSLVAQEIVASCIADRKKSYGLHRLGVTLHVYADTWAHQRFAGVCHDVNDISILDERQDPDASFNARLKDFFGDVWDSVTGRFVGDVLPLGHGAALSNPDKPFLSWKYRDCHGKVISRNNTDIFVDAAQQMSKAMQRYLAGDPRANVPGLDHGQRNTLGRWMADISDDNGKERHKRWLLLIGQGAFGFPAVKLEYSAKGVGSWKHQALGTTRKKDLKKEVFPYSPGFLFSDWKLFHDALMAHRFTVIHDILPKYGICAA
ncbi:MAG: hypothetical protein HKP58_07000 [Desulfatitalea sp.]|nr:hypothetical protein [Desulfatitalea sp.]NNK00144.1 hypothetical protein [Desulfatitalea sp.]